MQEEMVGMHAIRAYMLYLGILIHASVTYGVIDYTPAWTLKDHATHPFFDWLVSLIHCFRMPLFFVVSAYLGSMFNQAKGQKAMVMNLFVTIVSPFAFGLFLVLPLDALAFHYSNAVLHHESLSDFSAVDILRAAVAELGGKGGGGRPDLAQGGAASAARAEAAFAAAEAVVRSMP